jgi:predicted Zn-dependent protease
MRRSLSLIVLLCLVAFPARAQTMLRDGDIENALRALAAPVLAAAGLSTSRTRIVVLQDRQMNAFVLDREHIFLHSGLILRLKTAEQLQSVIAHEAAHIAGGHLSRRLQNIRTAKNVAGIGIALAMAAAASGNDGNAAAGLALGVRSSAERVLFGHTRAEESAADAAGLAYLQRAGISPHGYADVLDLFKGQELISSARQDPYSRTHPLSRDRLNAVNAKIGALPRTAPDPTAAYWFARAQGKLSAFLSAPSATLRATGTAPGRDEITLLRQAVAYHRMADASRARAAMDAAIALRPQDAYLHELKGQILLESRDAKGALAAYTTAARLAPRDTQVLAGLGRAQLAGGAPKSAITTLERARAADPSDPSALRDLASAYAQTGQAGLASLATSERYALSGRWKDAAINANRAAGLLPRGSSAWLRAQDVVSAAETAQKRK